MRICVSLGRGICGRSTTAGDELRNGPLPHVLVFGGNGISVDQGRTGGAALAARGASCRVSGCKQRVPPIRVWHASEGISGFGVWKWLERKGELPLGMM